MSINRVAESQSNVSIIRETPGVLTCKLAPGDKIASIIDGVVQNVGSYSDSGLSGTYKVSVFNSASNIRVDYFYVNPVMVSNGQSVYSGQAIGTPDSRSGYFHVQAVKNGQLLNFRDFITKLIQSEENLGEQSSSGYLLDGVAVVASGTQTAMSDGSSSGGGEIASDNNKVVNTVFKFGSSFMLGWGIKKLLGF